MRIVALITQYFLEYDQFAKLQSKRKKFRSIYICTIVIVLLLAQLPYVQLPKAERFSVFCIPVYAMVCA